VANRQNIADIFGMAYSIDFSTATSDQIEKARRQSYPRYAPSGSPSDAGVRFGCAYSGRSHI